MRGLIRSIILAALAACVVGALTVGSASAANMVDEPGKVALLAIYGNPGASPAVEGGVEQRPIGGGLGRNFGFGKNMLFRADTAAFPISKNLKITLPGPTVAEAGDSYIGGTLMSNKTTTDKPLSFTIQFVDFQDSTVNEVLTPSYADTSDRPWITEICSPESAIGACKTDAQAGNVAGTGSDPGEIKIENVSFDLGPGAVVQGTVWGRWLNGKAGVPPCIELHLPAAFAPIEHQTLVETQGAAVGAAIIAIAGKACLISANNDWYSGHEPEIKLER